MRARTRSLFNRRVLVISLVLAALVLLMIWPVRQLRPPSTLRLATGPEGEHEYQRALLYQQYMADEGVTLEIVPTVGSLEALAMAQAGDVDAGFMLNAANLGTDDTGLVALASVDHVPIWVFYRRELESDGPLTGLTDLRGQRVALGELRSGTRALSELLLQISQISEDEFDVVDASPRRSAEMLLNGEIDAMFLASGINSESILELMLAPEVEILDFELAETYTRLIPFLHEVELLPGSLNVAERKPATTKHLLTDANVIFAREDLHADMQILLLMAAIETENQIFDLFVTEETFPSIDDLTLPVSATTEQFLTEGRTLLQRYLPFWLATPLERFYLLVLPFMLLIYPLVRNTPMAYAFFMRRRVFVWYNRIRAIELRMTSYTIAELDERITELDALEQQLTETISVSTGYLQTFYNLRVHIRMVIARLEARKAYLEDQGYDRNTAPPMDHASPTAATADEPVPAE